MQNDVEHELLEFDDFCSYTVASFPPAVRVKKRVARRLNHHTRRVIFHDTIEHSPPSSRVVPSSYEHNGPKLMLIAPRRKHPAFTRGSVFGYRDLHDIRHAKQFQLANLPCASILVREPPADELVVVSTWRVSKNRNARCDASLHEVRRFERARSPGRDRTITSAGAIGSLTTSAHPAARRTDSRMEGAATMVAPANVAITARIEAHLGRR
jgi:hypothetical protein